MVAICDVASVMTSTYGVFLGFRALDGVGWAMFGTIATTTMVHQPGSQRRGRAVSLLLMSQTLGLLLGGTAGGLVHQSVEIGWLRTMTDSGYILGPLVMGALADAVHLSARFLLAEAFVSVLAWRCYGQASPERSHDPPVDMPLPTPDG